jgi:hypothetical protein
MGRRAWLVFGTISGLVTVAVALAVRAQAPTPNASVEDRINLPVANCNQTPDTRPDPSSPTGRSATPIVEDLLKSGQPCQQNVSGEGLLKDNPLGNLQRGFDFYSWLTFIALNAPADGQPIGKGPKPGGDASTFWESLKNYRPLAGVMLERGQRPTWGTREVPDKCKPFDSPDKIVIQLGEASWNQPFKTGPLIDQQGNYALFDILINQPMFNYIRENSLYSKEGQEKFAGTTQQPDIVFPIGVNPGGGEPGRMGAVMLKVSWRILDPEKDSAMLPNFHTVDALVFFPGNGRTKNGPECVPKKLGLVGFHVAHKTKFAEQWVWSTFEHVDNAPDEVDVAAGNFVDERNIKKAYNFYNPDCKSCPVNQTPPDPWDPPTSLKFPNEARSQVVRMRMLPTAVIQEVAELNAAFRKLLKGTVWENYMLVATQWPTAHGSKTDCNGSPAPTYLANTTLETYSQGRSPLASSSCMACHGNAATRHNPATPSDFTFILEKADCEDGRCAASAAPKRPGQNPRCGLFSK